MHKSQIDYRFIIASKQCAIKPWSKNINAAFKLLYNYVEKYYYKSKFYSGVNSFWVTQNSKPVHDTLNTPSNQKAAASVLTYDFSLYTNLPNDKLIKILSTISINKYDIAHCCKSS